MLEQQNPQVDGACPQMKVDREAFVYRLDCLGLRYPQLSRRIDWLQDHVEEVLSGDGEPILEMVDVFQEQTGYRLSLDWLLCGDGMDARSEKWILSAANGIKEGEHRKVRDMLTKHYNLRGTPVQMI